MAYIFTSDFKTESERETYLLNFKNPINSGAFSIGDIYYFRECKKIDSDYHVCPYFFQVEKIITECNEIHFIELESFLFSFNMPSNLFESIHLNYFPIRDRPRRPMKFKCNIDQFLSNFFIFNSNNYVSSFITALLDISLKDIKEVDVIKVVTSD